MVLIHTADQAGVSFWYPLGFRRSIQVRVIDWEKYKRRLPFRAVLKILLVGFGLLLFSDRIYTDNFYDLFALGVLLSSAASMLAFVPGKTIRIASITSVRLLPLAGVEFAGTFFALGIMMLVFIGQSDRVPLGAQGYDLAKFCTHLWPLAVFLFIYGSVPLFTGSAFIMRSGR